jgi:hypothetical protein
MYCLVPPGFFIDVSKPGDARPGPPGKPLCLHPGAAGGNSFLAVPGATAATDPEPEHIVLVSLAYINMQ